MTKRKVGDPMNVGEERRRFYEKAERKRQEKIEREDPATFAAFKKRAAERIARGRERLAQLQRERLARGRR